MSLRARGVRAAAVALCEQPGDEVEAGPSRLTCKEEQTRPVGCSHGFRRFGFLVFSLEGCFA